MTIYLVEYSDNDGYSSIFGAFSTIEKAREEILNFIKMQPNEGWVNNSDYWSSENFELICIRELELDKGKF